MLAAIVTFSVVFAFLGVVLFGLDYIVRVVFNYDAPRGVKILFILLLLLFVSFRHHFGFDF